MRIDTRFLRRALALILFGLASTATTSSTARAEDRPMLVGMGDSISEGVQSADANVRTQPTTYLNWIAYKMKAAFPLPLIASGPVGWVGDTTNRVRWDDSVASLDLAVSGATTYSLLNDRANATTAAEIDSETDLVLFPRMGSQMEVAESLVPQFVICWIGSNDALGTVISWDHLDASQLTSVQAFSSRFHEIGDRLAAMGSKVVFLNIPDVNSIAFAVDRDDMKALVGSDYGLPPGYRTSLIAMFEIKLGLADASLLQQPDYVLDPDELTTISTRIDAFNQIIDEVAAEIGAPVVDVHAMLQSVAASPPIIFGIPVGRRLLRGVFSLDGVHPSATTHAIIAELTIRAMNDYYGTDIPELTPLELFWTFLTEPHLDKDGDGVVRGRPFAGLLETAAPFLGISGDLNDCDASVRAPSGVPADLETRKQVMEEVKRSFQRFRR